MEKQDTDQLTNYERKLVALMRRLPPERGQQILDFARFIAYETFKPKDNQVLEDVTLLAEEYTENDRRWEALFASEESQNALDKLADEALADIRAGKARAMIFTPTGEISPG